MSKIILNNLASISGNEQSAIDNINANNDSIETFSNNVLARDGTAPNQMLADLDMNSKRILNLPAPSGLNDPLRLQDLNHFIGGTLSIPSLSNLPELYAIDYGVVADGVTDNTTALNNISSVIDGGSRTIIFPRGIIVFSSTWNMNGKTNVIVQGQGGLDLTYSGNFGTVFKFTGTGSVSAINMTDHRGFWWKDLQVVYSNNSFTGILFNTSTSFSTGCASGFENVQCYQVTNTGHTALACYYLKNNVDVTWRNCYVSHATFGWLGLFDADTGETNMIKLYNCTSIALKLAAVVNPKIGWSFYGCNFELSDTNTPAGILATGSHTITNFNLYSCVFADSTASGTWVDLPVDTFNFSMIGGAILALGGTTTGIKLGAAFNGTPTIHGVYFSGLNIGVNFTAATTGASIISCGFLSTTTPISGTANLDSTSTVFSNNGITGNTFNYTSDRGLLFVNQTSSAAGSTGTLTNAPAAGNPGYWLKIKVNGTNYSLPCWAG